jgi:predicted KAP-like P-loop ATPase
VDSYIFYLYVYSSFRDHFINLTRLYIPKSTHPIISGRFNISRVIINTIIMSLRVMFVPLIIAVNDAVIIAGITYSRDM